jgi:hypothetical protein
VVVDAVDEFRIAAGYFAEVVEQVPAGSLAGPGLGEWDLRALIGHTTRAVLTVETYLDRPAAAAVLESPAEYFLAVSAAAAADPAAVRERGRQAGHALADDPAGFVQAAVSRTLVKLNHTEDVLLETIVGGMRLSSYLPTRVFELVTHTLDICRATGIGTAPPSSVLARAVTLAAEVAARRGDGATVLLALTGRHPLPDGFSVV